MLKLNKLKGFVELLKTNNCESNTTIIISNKDFLITFHENNKAIFRNPYQEGDSYVFQPNYQYTFDGYNIIKAKFEPT